MSTGNVHIPPKRIGKLGIDVRDKDLAVFTGTGFAEVAVLIKIDPSVCFSGSPPILEVPRGIPPGGGRGIGQLRERHACGKGQGRHRGQGQDKGKSCCCKTFCNKSDHRFILL